MTASVTANEPSGDKTRTAYGHIRMEMPDEIEIVSQCEEIGTFCAARGLMLGAVFVDRKVPTLAHLSERPGIRRVFTSRITGTASRLLAVYGDEEQ